MSAKTKIVVVKMKHVILTGVLLGILLLLIIFAATYFFSGDEPKPAVEETGMYTPGVYNTSVALGGAAIDVSVAVDSNNINSISLEKWKTISLILYVVMGWSIITSMGTVISNTPVSGLLFLGIGGIMYTLGIIFYKIKSIKYMHFVWHLFVLAGSILHYFFVLNYCL